MSNNMLVLIVAIALIYPVAPREQGVNTYFGTQVTNPYGWLENVDSRQTRQWSSAEMALTTHLLNQMPDRPAMNDLALKLLQTPRDGTAQTARFASVWSRTLAN